VPRREKRRNRGLFQTIRHYFRRRGDPTGRRSQAGSLDRFYDAMTRFGHARPRRSVDAFERELYQAGLARPLGQSRE